MLSGADAFSFIAIEGTYLYMLSTVVHSLSTSTSDKQNETEISSLSHYSRSPESLSRSNLTDQYSFKNKFISVMKWFADPFRHCCSSMTRTQQSSKYLFESKCLKSQFNRVNGLLKYFAFGVMFTNGL